MSSAVDPPRPARHDDGPGSGRAGETPAAEHRDRRSVLAQQKERFGGMKFGACFFGWLTATGTAVLLTALLAAVGAGVGLAQRVQPGQVPTDTRTVGVVAAVVLLVIILVAYVAGGYVAGRMARFDGVRQGVGVWLWAVIIAVVVTVLSAVAGAQYDVLGGLNAVPRIPVTPGDLTVAGLVTALITVVVALVGAVLGGLAGMRYHRRVDRVTFADRG